jgi:hypothetical protein
MHVALCPSPRPMPQVRRGVRSGQAVDRLPEKKPEWAAFAANEDKTDLSAWLDNGTLTTPGDLPYIIQTQSHLNDVF